ncbi:type IV pilus assembly protein FimV [Zhongshania arctica]|uniref:FimV family protein n=1 Tax=Zhongshania arctica TaxID=3238302 RepID=A0ABV3TWR1_9GAMM
MGFGKLPAMLPLCVAVLMARDAMALGLGAANLDSKLGEPLFARIPIFGAEGIGSEQVRVTLKPVTDPGTGAEVASVDTRNLSAVGEVGEEGRGTIYLRSSKPVDEPYLHFMVNIRWPGGQLSRAYTFLLDLPESLSAVSVNTANLNTVAISNTPSTIASPARLNGQTDISVTPGLSPRSVNRPATDKQQTISADTAFYTTIRGDSLWSVARRAARAKGGTSNEWMTRLFRNNPSAFIRSNKNLLKERVTLDLFESLERGSTSGEAFVDSQLQQAPVPEVRSAVADIAGAPGSDRQNRVLGRETDVVLEPAGNGMTEGQLLQQNLSNVRNQVADVSANIALMTEKLLSLQTQLETLQSQAAILNTPAASDTASFEPPLGELLDSAETVGSVDGLASADLAQDDGVVVGEPTAVSTSMNTSLSEDNDIAAGAEPNDKGRVAAAPDVELSAVAITNTTSSSWSWLWWLAPVIGGLLLLIRYRQDREVTVSNGDDLISRGDLADVNAAVAAKAQADRAFVQDHFEDVFTALEASPVSTQKTILTPAIQATEPDAHGLKTNTKVDLNDRASLQEGKLGSASLADIDDDFFADLDEDALMQRGGLNDEAAFLSLDIPDFDESWSASAAVQAKDSLARASACMAMGDYVGARQILERDIASNDDISLKMQLLDVHAHCGDQDEFENLVLQMEFTGADKQLLREIDVLRELLLKNTDSVKKNRVD